MAGKTRVHESGDALEGNFVIEDVTEADVGVDALEASDGEAPDAAAAAAATAAAAPAHEDGEKKKKKKKKEKEKEKKDKKKGKKRPREGEEDAGGEEAGEEERGGDGKAAKAKKAKKSKGVTPPPKTPEQLAAEAARKEKKRAKLRALKERKREKRAAEEASASAAVPLERAPRGEQAAKLNALMKEHASKKDLGALELEKLVLKEEHFVEMKRHEGKWAHEVEQLPHQLRSLCAKSWKNDFTYTPAINKRPAGSPSLLILSHNALRVLDFHHGLRGFGTSVWKLFSRHIKIDEQVEQLQGVVQMAAGTPNRCLKLAERGALSFEGTKLVLLDGWLDSKKTALLTQREACRDTMELLRVHVLPRVQSGQIKLWLW